MEAAAIGCVALAVVKREQVPTGEGAPSASSGQAQGKLRAGSVPHELFLI